MDARAKRECVQQFFETSNVHYFLLEYSYCTRTIGSERALFFYRCTADNYRALVSRMLPSRQYFRALVNENEHDAMFTRSYFKNKLRVLFFIHCNSLIDLLEIYYQCLTSFYKAKWQEKWISAMKELQTLHTCKPALSTNGGG